MRRITLDQAKRFALGAQGFNRDRPTGRVDVRHFRRVVDDVDLIQLDSVNAFSRSHYMPFFSRLGPYEASSLDYWLWRSRELFEYWGHEASLIPVQNHKLYRWRMDRDYRWRAFKELNKNHPGFIEDVLRQVDERGPLQASDLTEPGERGDGMWDWSNGKVALEALFVRGQVTTADRPNFVRLYDLTERVIPHEHLDVEVPSPDEAKSELLVQAARSMGLGTAEDLGDYHRINMPQVRPLLEPLVESGQLIEVQVDGWDKPAYLHPDATAPRKLKGTALLSPFDNLVWCRPRVERLWDFHYRIEIYVPEAKRVYGYYVLPFLLDGELVGRVDLKTDRQESVLRVKGAFGEPGIDRVAVGKALREELETLAAWMGMDDVEMVDNGNLAKDLRG